MKHKVLDHMNGTSISNQGLEHPILPSTASNSVNALSCKLSKANPVFEDIGVVMVVGKEDLDCAAGVSTVPMLLQDSHTVFLHNTLSSFTLNEEQSHVFPINIYIIVRTQDIELYLPPEMTV